MTIVPHADVSAWPQPSIIIWVSPSGSDQWNGTQQYPYKTIERALQDFADGSQLRLMDGIYNPENSIVIDAFSGSIFAENPNNVLIQPSYGLVDAACISIKNSNRFYIMGVNITQAINSAGNQIGLYMSNVTNFVAYSCNVYAFDFQASHPGYGIQASGKGRIEKCYTYNLTGNIVYGIKATGFDIIDCEATSLSGTTVVGIEGDDKF